MLKHLFIGAALVLAGGASAQAQTLIDGDSTDAILSIAQGFGTAELATSSSGDPKITGEISGVPYQLFFMNCTDHKSCEDINFYAYFANKPALELINDWNRDRRFGRAYVDSELDATVEYDINLEHGITEENMRADFGVWATIVDQFGTHIGAR
jgi:hypothetical protein